VVEELRTAVRFPLRLPVAVRGEGNEVSAETKDISSGGVLFYVDRDLEVGTLVEFTVSMPGSVLGTPTDVLLRCMGRIVRRWVEGEQKAVAAVIDEYRFERQAAN
jgi:hypothetical protein